jgi:hypothetical protein
MLPGRPKVECSVEPSRTVGHLERGATFSHLARSCFLAGWGGSDLTEKSR